ncbi:unnamed protein product [Nippostrongylus brasiliensis]|uniref:ADP-ribosylation factor 1-like 2 n=1 Tax=Nippostrongylus brasiliensis TaxID=27835 RepID=A0A158R2E8_NIPBR|nr:unnamed protein product [Nippostrongylus brasiliensis]
MKLSGLYQETFDHGNVTYKAWDIGFHARLRGLYKCNFVSAKCFIFVVDSTDRARMHWIRDEIQELVQDRLRRGVPLLIYANKQDLPDALTPEEIEKALDLQKIRDRQWYVQPCCAVTGVGLGEGLDWLQATIAASKCLEPSRQVDMFVMFFIMLLLTIFLPSEQNVKEKEFVGAEHWDDEFLKQCSEPTARYGAVEAGILVGGKVLDILFGSLLCQSNNPNFPINCHIIHVSDEHSCYSFMRGYELLKIEVLNKNPILVIFREFAPQHFVEDFMRDVERKQLFEQGVVKKGEENTSVLSSIRRANGTWIEHMEMSGAARLFRKVTSLLPFVNFQNTEPWQVLSYKTGGHYVPHYDYIDYSSIHNWDDLMWDHGNRFATFLVVLRRAAKGGGQFLEFDASQSFRDGTVFPTLKQTVVAAPGDAVFWTNMDYSGAKDEDSIHGACPVYDGVKVATVLWIHTKEQAIFLSSVENKLFDLDRLVGTKASHNLGLCKLKENSQA